MQGNWQQIIVILSKTMSNGPIREAKNNTTSMPKISKTPYHQQTLPNLQEGNPYFKQMNNYQQI